MAPSNKFLSPTCAPAHGDIDTYFFFEKIFRFDGGMCVSKTGIFCMSKNVFRRKSHIFADFSVGWHLEKKSRNFYVRLLMEISPHTFFWKKYFDPMEKCAFQWRHFWRYFLADFLRWCHWNTHSSIGSKYFFKKKVCGDISMSRRTCWWKEFVAKCHPTELSFSVGRRVKLVTGFQ